MAAGFNPIIAPAAVAECEAEWLEVEELVTLNAGLKSAALWMRYPRAVVLGVDTLVCLDGKALGKPADLKEGFRMIERLAGRAHQVFSGVCLSNPASGQTTQFVDRTTVRFRELSTAEISAYLTLIDPLDKAGGYAAQEHGERIIASTEGSWSNILGLPMERLQSVLADVFGIRPGADIVSD